MELIRERVQVAVEQVGVDAQGDRCVLVAEHPRQRQHVAARRDSQAGAGVSKAMCRRGVVDLGAGGLDNAWSFGAAVGLGGRRAPGGVPFG